MHSFSVEIYEVILTRGHKKDGFCRVGALQEICVLYTDHCES